MAGIGRRTGKTGRASRSRATGTALFGTTSIARTAEAPRFPLSGARITTGCRNGARLGSVPGMTSRHALWLPLFDASADPGLVARLAAEAEEAGWDGVFVRDHLRWREPVAAAADPWITLAAIATATSKVRFGPMVSAITRRRPAKLARETATLDRLGGGRLTLGVGLGSDRFGEEFSRFGEECVERVRPLARRVAGVPGVRLVRRSRGPPLRALHGGRHPVPADTDEADPGLGGGLLRVFLFVVLGCALCWL